MEILTYFFSSYYNKPLHMQPTKYLNCIKLISRDLLYLGIRDIINNSKIPKIPLNTFHFSPCKGRGRSP